MIPRIQSYNTDSRAYFDRSLCIFLLEYNAFFPIPANIAILHCPSLCQEGRREEAKMRSHTDHAAPLPSSAVRDGSNTSHYEMRNKMIMPWIPPNTRRKRAPEEMKSDDEKRTMRVLYKDVPHSARRLHVCTTKSRSRSRNELQCRFCCQE